MTISLDAGHGGTDTGVISRCGLEEADLALRIAQLVDTYAMFIYREEPIKLIRGSHGYDPSLSARNQIACAQGAELVISIHANASKNHDQHGGLALHWPSNEQGRVVADQIHRALPLVPSTYRSPPATPRLWPHAYNVIRSYRATCVLVEVGYLDRTLDAAQLSRPDILTATALAILQGIALWRDIRIPW